MDRAKTTSNGRTRKSISRAEQAKVDSRGLRGDLAEELQNPLDHFSASAVHVIKHHGVYQQDDRDRRHQGQKSYSCFVRTRLPGGVMSSVQLLAELSLCEQFGNGTLRLTDRQGVQIHGIQKSDLAQVIRTIENTDVTTLGACGDVLRNVMCCPAPINDSVRHQMQRLAATVSRLFLPQTTAYRELWLREGDHSEKLAESQSCEEPVYGSNYLPRKFKIGFALPDDNCIDVLTHDLGFVAVIENGELVGFDAWVGGGMGVTPARADTFAAIGTRIGFVPTADVPTFCQTVIELFRDHGIRTDRRLSRLRYLIADWGCDQFVSRVEERFGSRLGAACGAEISGSCDHLGWNETASGEFWLGLYLPSGRLQDTDDWKMKSAVARLAKHFQPEFRVTPHQNLLICGITEQQRTAVSTILDECGIATDPTEIQSRRIAMACPALPMCGLAITEAERVMPDLLDSIDEVLRRYGLEQESLSVRMTGCPNGCARPYVAEIGIVGKARNRYTLFLGGSRNGTRMAFQFLDMVPLEQIPAVVEHTVAFYSRDRQSNESFGDFCHRVGKAALLEHSEWRHLAGE